MELKCCIFCIITSFMGGDVEEGTVPTVPHADANQLDEQPRWWPLA